MIAQFFWRWANSVGWVALIMLVVALQACGGSSNTNFSSNGNGGNVSTNRAVAFSGSILLVKDGNLLILRGKDESVTTLTANGSAFQPSISPSGATVAFELRKPGSDYSDLATMPLAGGSIALHTDDRLVCKCDPDKSGVFHYQFWAGNPIWTADGKQLIYLSDFYKGGRQQLLFNQTCPVQAQGDSIQDLGIVETPANAQPVPAISATGYVNRLDRPRQLAWPYCYAGGDQDLSLRPGVSDTEVLFTSFQYTDYSGGMTAQISLLIIPNDGSPPRIIQLSPSDPKVVLMEPSWSPDGRYITYIRRANGQDNLYIMPVDATVQNGTPNTLGAGVPERYSLEGGGSETYSTNTTYYNASQKLASGIIGQPAWGANNQLFFVEFENNAFNLYLAKVSFSASAPGAGATPGATATPGSAPAITLDGSPKQLTQNGIDGGSRPVWLNA
jgi:Tol biopolymer transport system component